MANNSLFGNDFLVKVVEWSNLASHSGKLFHSLEKESEDSVGYVSVGLNVIEYVKMRPEIENSFEAKKAHCEHLKNILVMPNEPHSSERTIPRQKDNCLIRSIVKGKLDRIQRRVGRDISSLDLKDPLEKCYVLQHRAVEDVCEQLAKFPNRIRIKSELAGGTVAIDIGSLPLLKETVDALGWVRIGPIALLGGQEGITFKFRYFSQRKMNFL